MDIPIILFILFAILAFFVMLYFVPVNLWITATLAGVRISLLELFFMRIRKSPVKDIVHGLVVSTKAGLGLNSMDLETHALAGGNVPAVVKTMIQAKNQKLEVTYNEVTAIDLAGEDLSKFLELKRNQSKPGYKEKREALVRKIYKLTDDQIDDLERYLEGRT